MECIQPPSGSYTGRFTIRFVRFVRFTIQFVRFVRFIQFTSRFVRFATNQPQLSSDFSTPSRILGVMAAKTATMKALGQVIRSELPDEIQAARLATERARLAVERAGMAAADAEGQFQNLDSYDPALDGLPAPDDSMEAAHWPSRTIRPNWPSRTMPTHDGTATRGSTARALYQVARHELPELATARLEAERARLEVERSRMMAADAQGHFERRFLRIYPDDVVPDCFLSPYNTPYDDEEPAVS